MRTVDNYYRNGRLYDRLFEQCATSNQLAQLQMRIENRITPLETCALAAHIKRTYAEGPIRRRINWLRIERDRRQHRELVVGTPRLAPRYLRAVHATQWADTVMRYLTLSHRPPVPVGREWSRGAATLYRSAAIGPRTLVITFTSTIDGFMLPINMFLQFVGEHPVDVLKLASPNAGGYLTGVRPFSHDFPSTLAWLTEFAERGEYDRIVSVGASAGAVPALLAAASLETESALAAGPAAFRNADQLAAQLGAASALDILARIPSTCDVTMTCGALSVRDSESVDRLAGALPNARVIRVADAGHASLFELAERDELAPLFRTVIQGSRAHTLDAT